MANEYFTINTLEPILPKSTRLIDVLDRGVDKVGDNIIFGTDYTHNQLEKIIGIVSMRTQPMIVGKVTGFRDSLTSLNELGFKPTDDGDGKDTVYTIKFAFDKLNIWSKTILEQELIKIPSFNSGNVIVLQRHTLV